jgi:L-ribulose-5-phosphate 3-epimerase
VKLTFEVWPNMPWGRLEAAGPAWNSWGDKPLVWCAERIAENGYDGIDVIVP